MPKCVSGLVALGVNLVVTVSPSTAEVRETDGGAAAAIEVSRNEVPEKLFDTAEPLHRATLIEAVLAHNPNLEAAHQAWQAALARESKVAALADPTLGYSLAPLSIGSGDVRFGQRIELSQRLPYPGVRRT